MSATHSRRRARSSDEPSAEGTGSVVTTPGGIKVRLVTRSDPQLEEELNQSRKLALELGVQRDDLAKQNTLLIEELKKHREEREREDMDVDHKEIMAALQQKIDSLEVTNKAHLEVSSRYEETEKRVRELENQLAAERNRRSMNDDNDEDTPMVDATPKKTPKKKKALTPITPRSVIPPAARRKIPLVSGWRVAQLTEKLPFAAPAESESEDGASDENDESRPSLEERAAAARKAGQSPETHLPTPRKRGKSKKSTPTEVRNQLIDVHGKALVKEWEDWAQLKWKEYWPYKSMTSWVNHEMASQTQVDEWMVKDDDEPHGTVLWYFGTGYMDSVWNDEIVERLIRETIEDSGAQGDDDYNDLHLILEMKFRSKLRQVHDNCRMGMPRVTAAGTLENETETTQRVKGAQRKRQGMSVSRNRKQTKFKNRKEYSERMEAINKIGGATDDPSRGAWKAMNTLLDVLGTDGMSSEDEENVNHHLWGPVRMRIVKHHEWRDPAIDTMMGYLDKCITAAKDTLGDQRGAKPVTRTRFLWRESKSAPPKGYPRAIYNPEWLKEMESRDGLFMAKVLEISTDPFKLPVIEEKDIPEGEGNIEEM